jgi:hypothetical protein
MKAALLFALTLLTPSPSFAETIIIRDDPGGYMNTYIKKYEHMARRHDIPIIVGTCWSACTFVLRVPRACAAENAVFAFHQAYNTSHDSIVTSFRLNNETMFLYPKYVQRELIRRGGLSDTWIFIKATELLPMCNG